MLTDFLFSDITFTDNFYYNFGIWRLNINEFVLQIKINKIFFSDGRSFRPNYNKSLRKGLAKSIFKFKKKTSNN